VRIDLLARLRALRVICDADNASPKVTGGKLQPIFDVLNLPRVRSWGFNLGTID